MKLYLTLKVRTAAGILLLTLFGKEGFTLLLGGLQPRDGHRVLMYNNDD